MKKLFYLSLIFYNFFLLGQDTIYSTYGNKNYFIYINDENKYYLEPVLILNKSVFKDAYYVFFDSINRDKVRLAGEIVNYAKKGLWYSKDVKGITRKEEIFPIDTIEHLVIVINYDSLGKVENFSAQSNFRDLKINFNKNGIREFSEGGNEKHFLSKNYNILIDSNKIIQKEYWYSNGKFDGERVHKYLNGNLFWSQNYKNGLKIGKWQYGLINNTILCTEDYENDKLVKIIFVSGKTYVINDKEIDILEYYPNGKLRINGCVRDGKKIGDWKFYDETGALIGKTHHDDEGNCVGFTGQFKDIPFF